MVSSMLALLLRARCPPNIQLHEEFPASAELERDALCALGKLECRVRRNLKGPRAQRCDAKALLCQTNTRQRDQEARHNREGKDEAHEDRTASDRGLREAQCEMR